MIIAAFLSVLFLSGFKKKAAAESEIHLQDEDKVVDRFVSLEEVVLRSVFVLGIELELLHNAGMFDEAQQDLF